MVRLTVELIDNAPQFINTVRERELNLRGYKIPVIENMGVTRKGEKQIGNTDLKSAFYAASNGMQLSGWATSIVDHSLDQFDVIDLTDNDVKRLDNLPLLKRMHTLYLHNNRVHYIQPDIGEKLPNLKILALTNNNITELGDIDPLANCKNLEYVTFIGNPITHKTNYRNYIIYKLPSVRVIDFKRVRLAERQAALKMFKGKKGQKARDAIKRSTNAPPETENNEVSRVSGSALTPEDRIKIQNAIASARSLAEVEYLQSVLASGRIPEKGWNKQMLLPTEENHPVQDGGFMPESEEPEHPNSNNAAMETNSNQQNGGGNTNAQANNTNGNGNRHTESGMEVDGDSGAKNT